MIKCVKIIFHGLCYLEFIFLHLAYNLLLRGSPQILPPVGQSDEPVQAVVHGLASFEAHRADRTVGAGIGHTAAGTVSGEPFLPPDVLHTAVFAVQVASRDVYSGSASPGVPKPLFMLTM